MIDKLDGKSSFIMEAQKSVGFDSRQSLMGKVQNTNAVAPQSLIDYGYGNDIVEVSGNLQNNKDNEQEFSKEDVEDISDKLNSLMEELNCDISFSYYEKLDRMMMQIIDRRTNEVIKEFPPEETMKSLEKIHDWIGVLLDEEA